MLQYLNAVDMEPRIKLAPEARRGKIDWKLWTNEIEREVSGDWALKKEEEKVVGFSGETDISPKKYTSSRQNISNCSKGNIAMNAKWRPTDDDGERTSQANDLSSTSCLPP